MKAAFRRNATRAFGCLYFILAGRAWRASRQTVWRNFSSIGKHGNLRVNKHFDFPDEAVSAEEFSRSSGGVAQGIAMHANGIDMFKDFDRSVQRIGHVTVRGVSSVAAGTGAGAARDRLIICKWAAAGPRVHASKRQVVHGALARRWNS